MEKDLTGLLFTVGAGGFLPGVAPGCFGYGERPLTEQRRQAEKLLHGKRIT